MTDWIKKKKQVSIYIVYKKYTLYEDSNRLTVKDVETCTTLLPVERKLERYGDIRQSRFQSKDYYQGGRGSLLNDKKVN